MNLAMVKKQQQVRVKKVTDQYPDDPVAQRLRELGFVDGEPVTVVARGLFGGNPLVVKVGSTRFALRKLEATRVEVESC